MRTLTANQLSEVAKASTAPVYLIWIDVGTGLRFSTRQSVTWDGNSYSGGVARLTNLDLRPIRSTITLVAANHDNAVSALVLGNYVGDQAAKVWAVYGTGASIATADPVLIFDGVVERVPKGDRREVEIILSDASSSGYNTPKHVIAPPLCNHIPPQGTVITWGGESFSIE